MAKDCIKVLFYLFQRSNGASLASISLLGAIMLSVSLSTHGSEASLVRMDMKGGNWFHDVTEVDGVHYLKGFNSNYLNVYDFSLQGEDSVLGHLEFNDNITSLADWNDNLAVSYDDKLQVFDVDGATKTYLFGTDTAVFSSSPVIATSEQFLVYFDLEGLLKVVQQQGDNYSLFATLEVDLKKDDLSFSTTEVAVGIEQNTIYLAFFLRSEDQSKASKLIINKLQIQGTAVEQVAHFELEATRSTYSRLIYTNDGRFAFNDNDHLIHLIGEGENGLSLIDTISDSGSLGVVHMAYHKDELWVAYFEKVLRSYEVSSQTTRRTRNVTVEKVQDSSYLPTLFKGTPDGLLSATLFDFFKAGVNEGEVSFDYPYIENGSPGDAVYLNDYLFQPIGNRIHQYSISADHKLRLEHLYDEQTSAGSLDLITDGQDIWAFDGFGKVFHFELQDGRLEQVGYRDFGFSLPEVFLYQGKLHFSRFNYGIVTITTGEQSNLFTSADYFSTKSDDGLYGYMGTINGYLFALDSTQETLVRLEAEGNDFTLKSSTKVGSVVLKVVYVNDLIYVHSFDGVEIFQVDENGGLSPATNETTEGFIRFIAGYNNTLFTARQYGSGALMKVYDMSDSNMPKLISETRMPHFWSYNGHLTPVDTFFWGAEGDSEPLKLYQLNYTPTVPDSELRVTEDTPFELDTRTLDPESDLLDITLIELPSNGEFTFEQDLQLLRYVPNPEYSGTDSARLKLTDVYGNESEGTILLNVTSVNDAPQVNDHNFTLSQDSWIDGQLRVSDPDDTEFTFSILSNVAHGTLSLDELGGFSYFPDWKFAGTDSFTVRVEDSRQEGSEFKISLHVVPANNSPNLSPNKLPIKPSRAPEISSPYSDIRKHSSLTRHLH